MALKAEGLGDGMQSLNQLIPVNGTETPANKHPKRFGLLVSIN